VTVIVNAYLGMLSKVMVLIVQLASVAPRTRRCGCRSSCTKIMVSALCVQTRLDSMAEVMLVVRYGLPEPLMLVICTPSLKTYMRWSVKHSM